MVSTLRLVLYHLVLQLVVNKDTLLLSPGSPATSAGLNQTLALQLVAKHNSCDTDSNVQKHSLIFVNQSYELTTSTGLGDACNNFLI
jgi:hypothetical protein